MWTQSEHRILRGLHQPPGQKCLWVASPEPTSSHHPQVHITVLAEFSECHTHWGDEAGFQGPLSPGWTAAGSQSLLQKAPSTLQKQVEANSVQSPFLPEARWTGTGRLPFHPHTRPHSSPGQPTLTPTSIAPPDVSLAPAHSPLVLQCRRRAHSVHVTSLAGEDPTKLDPDISVYPTGHGKRSDVQMY